jgi:sarcosine oxidase subunit gamma
LSAFADAGVRFSETPFLGHFNLRGNLQQDGLLEAVRKTTGVTLPEVPNTSESAGGCAALWLGPDEWLLVTPVEQGLRLFDRLRQALVSHRSGSALTDISSGQTVFRLSGPSAIEVLAKGCSIDLDPNQFQAGQCVQTSVAKANALIWRRDESISYDLIVRRSFAEYLALWIEDAAHEFGFHAIQEAPGPRDQATRAIAQVG